MDMTKYSADTLINTIAWAEDLCRSNKAKCESADDENLRESMKEYWQKEYDDLEKLSVELWNEKIVR